LTLDPSTRNQNDNPITGKKQLVLMSEEQEIEMGKQYDPQVIALLVNMKMKTCWLLLKKKAQRLERFPTGPILNTILRF